MEMAAGVTPGVKAEPSDGTAKPNRRWTFQPLGLSFKPQVIFQGPPIINGMKNTSN